MAKYGRKILRNKKGSVLDLIFVGIFCLAFAFAVMVGFKVTTELNSAFQASDIVPAEGKAASTSLLGEFSTTMDYSFLFLIVGLSVGVLILAAMVRVHPIFIVLYIIGLLIVIFLAGIFSNIYQGLAEDVEFTALADQLLFVDKIMTFLPWFVAIAGTLLAIIMYKSYQDGMEGG